MSPRRPAVAPPRPSQAPKEPGGLRQKDFFFAGKRSKFHGDEAIELKTGRNCGGSGMGVGEGIGSDGTGGAEEGRGERVEREGGKRGSAYWWVLVLSEQTTAWFFLSFIRFFGWVLFGYALSLSSEEWNGTTLLLNYMQGQADLLTSGLFILSPPADPHPLPVSVFLSHQ
jgi:hypothetical protein